MSNPQTISRVHYYANQYLTPDDFNDEQAYHVAMRRRHLLAHHIAGIVEGLTLTVDGDEVYVAPGTAIDGYGRELYLPEKAYLTPSDFALNGNSVDVYLEYDRVSLDDVPASTCSLSAMSAAAQSSAAGAAAASALRLAADSFTAPAGGTVDVNSALVTVQSLLRSLQTAPDSSEAPAFNRWVEMPRLRVETAQGQIDRRNPTEVPSGDHDFPATDTPPDDPANVWPVFVGQATLNPNGTYSVDLTGCPYAGLRAEFLEASSGRASIRFEGAMPAAQPYAVAVYVDGVGQSEESGSANDGATLAMGVKSDGSVDLFGDTTVLGGELTLANGSVDFAAANDVSKLLTPIPPRPWQIYRQIRAAVGAETADPSLSNAPTPAANTFQELCVEIPINTDKSSPVSPNQFVIGSSTTDGKFFPALTVDQNGVVTVHGNLVVQGTITQGHTAPGGNSPAAENFIAGMTSTGQVLGSSLLLRNSGLFQNNQQVALDYFHTDTGRADLADAFVGEDDALDVFALKLAAKPDALKHFFTTLTGLTLVGNTAAGLVAASAIDPLTEALAGLPGNAGMNALALALGNNTTAAKRTDQFVTGLHTATAIDALTAAIVNNSQAVGDLATALAGSSTPTVRTDQFVNALHLASAIAPLTEAIAKNNETITDLATALKDNSTSTKRTDKFVTALHTAAAIDPLTESIANNNDAITDLATALKDNSTSTKRTDKFVTALHTAAAIDPLTESMANNNDAITDLATALKDNSTSTKRTDKFVTALHTATAIDPLTEAIAKNNVAIIDLATALALNTTSATRTDKFVTALAGLTSNAGMVALAASLANNGMSNFAASLAEDNAPGHRAIDALTTALSSPATGMAALVASFVRQSASIDALTTALSSPATGMESLVASLVRVPASIMTAFTTALAGNNGAGMNLFATSLPGANMTALGAALLKDAGHDLFGLLDALVETDSAGKSAMPTLVTSLDKTLVATGKQDRLIALARGLEDTLTITDATPTNDPTHATGPAVDLLKLARSVPTGGAVVGNFANLFPVSKAIADQQFTIVL